jgi:hypothetical protein
MCFNAEKVYVEGFRTQKKGWTKRGVYDEPRLTEVLSMYEEIGFIVKIEPYSSDIEVTCNECVKQNPEKYKVLYTKKNDAD